MAEEVVRQFFQSYRSPSWIAPVDVLPQESNPLSEPTPINPAGWLINSTANVVVDDEGLHVFDGSIFIEDDSGEAVLSASGFGGAWSDFVNTGIYNSRFRGTTGPLAVTEVVMDEGTIMS